MNIDLATILNKYKDQKPQKNSGDIIWDRSYPVSAVISIVDEYTEQFKPKWQDVDELQNYEVSNSWFFIARHGKLIGSSYTLNQVKDYAKSGIATHFFELSLPELP